MTIAFSICDHVSSAYPIVGPACKENFPSGCSLAAELDFDSGPAALVLNSTKLWKPGRELGIWFLGGTTELQKNVQGAAEQWKRYTNIAFKFFKIEPSELRNSFEKGNGK